MDVEGLVGREQAVPHQVATHLLDFAAKDCRVIAKPEVRRREPGELDSPVDEAGLAQTARTLPSDDEHGGGLDADPLEHLLRQQGQRMDSRERHPIPRDGSQPGREPLRPGQRGEQHPVIPAALRRSPQLERATVGGVAEQAPAPGCNEGAAIRPDHPRNRVLPKLFFYQVHEHGHGIRRLLRQVRREAFEAFFLCFEAERSFTVTLSPPIRVEDMAGKQEHPMVAPVSVVPCTEQA